MKIGYLGAGTWGFCLATILGNNGHEVVVWCRNPELAKKLQKERKHPKLEGVSAPDSLYFTSSMEEALSGAETIVESVTSAGIRPVFEKVFELLPSRLPIVLTSKGIEQNTGLLLPEVIFEMMGKKGRDKIGCLSGPSHAEEAIKGLPTSVVCSGFQKEVMHLIKDLFSNATFRIYPNSDVYGVSFGGAMKNIIAIACGISDGLGFGDNTKAAIMTRGLHEIRKLCVVKGCKKETLNGLSGLGDLCVTCLSTLSRNYKFGQLIAQGYTTEEAKKKIGMAVEGTYSCISALQLGKKHRVPVPITEAVHTVLYENLNPKEAVKQLLQRAIKEEHL